MIGITVWICPTSDCGNYYASSSAGNLRMEWNTDAKGNRTFPRSRCPDCKIQRGIDVDRVPVVIGEKIARSLLAL